MLTCGELSFDTRARTAVAKEEILTLTRKETGILEYLMVHQGRPVSQEEPMEHVWGNSVDNFSNSIRVHISALRKKSKSEMMEKKKIRSRRQLKRIIQRPHSLHRFLTMNQPPRQI